MQELLEEIAKRSQSLAFLSEWKLVKPKDVPEKLDLIKQLIKKVEDDLIFFQTNYLNEIDLKENII